MKNLIILAALATLGTAACRKAEVKNRQVYGQMVDSATQRPLARAAFVLVRQYTDGHYTTAKREEEPVAFSTDDAGYFRVQSTAHKNDHFYITHPGVSVYYAGYQFWEGSIGLQEEINVGVIKAYAK